MTTADLLALLDLALDLVSMMPPLNEVASLGTSREESMLIGVGAVGFLAVVTIATAFQKSGAQHMVVAGVVAVCVIALGVIGLGLDTVKAIYASAYPPMVIALRCGEGITLGERVSRVLRWWHVPLFAGLLVGLYLAIRPFGREGIAIATGAWGLVGALIAAALWTRALRGSPLTDGPLALLAWFLVFAATLVYVTTSPLERALYQWVLPVGFLGGVIGGRWGSRRRAQPREDSSQV